jgi:hypothetical protein
MNWDLFISHASEDKADIARPLADMLQAKGYKVWYDEYALTLGDNLRHSIEQGLAQSQFGVVILSANFFAKKWTNLELDGLFALEKRGQKRILPVWHNVTAGDVESYSSFMAMRMGVPTSKGLDHVVQQIIQAVEGERNALMVESTVTPSIHPRSIELLLAAKESNGSIRSIWHMRGFDVSVGHHSFGPEDDPRTISLNLHCLNELVMSGLAEQRSQSLIVLTQEGFDYEVPEGVIQAPALQLPKITPANAQLAQKLMQGATAGNGRIMSTAHLNGRSLQAGRLVWESGGDRRIEASWKSMLKELIEKGLLLPRSEQVFLVSHLGFLWIDAVNAHEQQKNGSTANGEENE